MRSLLYLLALSLSFSLSAQEVIITGILDGDLGGSPRAIEIYVNGSVDLNGYDLVRYSNGSGTPTDDYSLSGTFTDEFVYIINNQHETLFNDAFGGIGDFGNRLLGTNLFGTGDDVFTIENGGTIIDQTGGTIGDGANIYQDSYLYRNDNTGPDGSWVPANWQLPGNFVLDGEPIGNYAGIVPFGSYSTTPPSPATGVTANGDLTEPSTDGGFTLTLSEVAAGDVTITYSLTGTATSGSDFTDPNGGSAIITMGNTSVSLPIEVMDDGDSEQTETIELTITGVSDATFSTGASATISVFDDEPVSTVFIHFVQGNGTSSQLAGQTVSVEGIVVGDFQGGAGSGLSGFFVQEEDADNDADPQTSEGIFVFDGGSGIDVAEGDLVTITGQVEEQAQLTLVNVTVAGASIVIVSSGNSLPSAAMVDLPVAAQADLEAFEGMRATLIDEVTITENFDLGRYNGFDVSETERLIQFTECNDSDPALVGPYNDLLARSTITIDDGRAGNNNSPIMLPDGSDLSPTNSLRAGTKFTGLTGIMDERKFASGSEPITYRLQFEGFTSQTDNTRPAAPVVGGFVKVVGMNVLNYFITLNSRGADNADEFDRQEAKIVAAIIALDADILGLSEIERIGADDEEALEALTDAIADAGGPAYDYVLNPNAGGDQIMVALIYKPDVVEESGTAANLTVASGFFSSNRVPLAQTFRVIEPGHQNFGQQITVCVNHWKSKGGSCNNTTPDDDNGGAGSCNGTRLAGATAILNWLTNDDPTGTGITDQLVIGDLNAYSQEEPVTVFTDAGWSNTVRDNAVAGSFPCGSVPSYVFRGQWGSLDHALASPSLVSKVTGAIPWGVNAEEPTVLDYDTQFNDPALFAADPYRFSDHNPVVVGLNLGNSLPVTLASFTGEASGKLAKLNWRTETEEMTDRFVVERRVAGSGFTAIGTVDAAGNSSQVLDYAFTDTEPALGANDYRLRMTDQDGSFEFSHIVTLSFQSANGADLRQVAPGQLRLSGAEAGAEYLFTNATGAVLRRGKANENATDIDSNNLPAGVYFLLLREPIAGARTLKVILR